MTQIYPTRTLKVCYLPMHNPKNAHLGPTVQEKTSSVAAHTSLTLPSENKNPISAPQDDLGHQPKVSHTHYVYSAKSDGYTSFGGKQQASLPRPQQHDGEGAQNKNHGEHAHDKRVTSPQNHQTQLNAGQHASGDQAEQGKRSPL